MPKIRPTLNSADIELLEKRFATKDDLKAMEGRQDKKYATKEDLKSLATKKDIKRIENKLDEHFNYLDKDVSYFRQQTAQHLGIPVSKLIRSSD